MRLTRVIALALALGMVGGARVHAAGQDLAEAYNIKGMEFYHQRQYDSAEIWFREAVKENPDHKLANYNLACVLSLQLSRDHWGWHLEYGDKRDPFAQLKRAIELDPAAAQKAAQDPDFMNIRLTPKFQMFIGADLMDSQLIKMILVGQGEWFGIPPGTWGGNDLLFFETGRVCKRIYTVNSGGMDILMYDCGNYSIDAGAITMRFASGDIMHGHFDDNGDLQTGANWQTRYVLFPSGNP
jgi:tetratricopeptide (TPR) repeat protein